MMTTSVSQTIYSIHPHGVLIRVAYSYYFNHNFPDMLLRFEVSVSINSLVKREDFINNRLGLPWVSSDEPVHFFESVKEFKYIFLIQ